MLARVWHSDRKSKHSRGNTILELRPGTVLLGRKKEDKRVKDFAEITQVKATIGALQAEQQIPSTLNAA